LYLASSRITRLLLVAASYEGLLGLGIYLTPRDFQAQYYAPMRPYFPYLSAWLMASAVILLILARYPLRPILQRIGVMLPAAPLLLMAYMMGSAGLRAAPFFYTALALGVVAIPWFRPAGERWDLFDLTAAAIQLPTGIHMLAFPETYSAVSYFAILPALPLVGAAGVVGSFALFVPKMLIRGWLTAARSVVGATLPLTMMYNSFQVGLTTGVLGWALLALAILIGHRGLGKAAAPRTTAPGTLGHLDRSLETWSWILALAILFIDTVAPGDPSPAARVLVHLFVLAVTVYTAAAHWIFPDLGSDEQRVWWHFIFLTVAIGSLTGDIAPGGPGFLVLLVIPPVMAARSLGARAGTRLLLLAVTMSTLGHLRDHFVSTLQEPIAVLLSHIVGQGLLLSAAGTVGIRHAQELRRAHKNLYEQHQELQGAHQSLQAQDEELVAQQEELQAQNEELQLQRTQLEEALEAQTAAEGDRKRSEAALRESERRFRSAFGMAPIGMALSGADGQWLEVNRSLAAMLGYTEAELVALDWRRTTHPEDMATSSQQARAVMSGAIPACQFEKRYVHRDGHTVWAQLSCSSIQDEQGTIAYAIIHIQDITERKLAEAQLVQLANYDTLTGLFNRRRFQEELCRELVASKRYGTSGALLFLDLDQFKYVNDSLGHMAGDDLLKSVTTLLQQRLRAADTIGRLGGDEFAILLPHTDISQARLVAEDLLKRLRSHKVAICEQLITVTASIGIALYPEHGDTAEELLAKADLAMYQVKEQGRNGCAVYRAEQSEQSQMESKLTWERRILEALEKDQFVPFFQPIMDLQTHQIVRYELLLRLMDKEGHVVLPGAFLAVAERFGLIHAVDRWVVRRAIRLTAERQKTGRPICLEVNLSGKAFSDPELLPLIRQELAGTGVTPESLILEITETAAIADTHLARQFVEELGSLGCRFAIDDFGAGFSSFSYLKHLPVDYLKIDGSFIQNLAKDPVDQHLVKTMVDLARGLGIRTIAEFVGDEQTLALLQDYGVDFAQGYYIGRPAPLEEQIAAI